MKVSSKIVAGFLFLILLAIVVLINHLSAIHQIQSANRELSEINLVSAKTAVQMQKLADLIDEVTKKYFSALDKSYDRQVIDNRDEFQRDILRLRETARSTRERAETDRLQQALDEYWTAFNLVKVKKEALGPYDLPPHLSVAMKQLQLETEMMLNAVQAVIDERVQAAADIGKEAERVTWIAGSLSLLLGVLVAALIVRSINDPLRRLVKGTQALAKGQFWHRLRADGRDEFAELAAHFNTMTERLSELDQMKKDFVSHVSHDLKAPLASIRQVMHLLLQGIPGSLNEQQKHLIQLSYNSAERLAAMVGNLLDVSRMEAGAMEYRMADCDIAPLIKEVAAEFDVQATEKNVRLRIECESPSVLVQCDRERIVQVIGNLYENALKFSPSHNEILTRIDRDDAGLIRVCVSDAGPGIPDDHKERIFEKFHQVKYGKKVAGQGVGLGLAICKTIVEAHRGKIWVEDNPTGGSMFLFILQPGREEVVSCGQTA
jgi:signal transduction histidine kinase